MKFIRKGFRLAVASSPGQRHKLRLIQNSSFIDNLNPIVKDTFKRLQHGATYNAGRNNHGRITVRGLGGGNKTNRRVLDLKRLTTSIGIVINISYDPNRNANIASILYNQHDSSAITYQIATHGLVLGQIVQSGSDAPHVLGNTLPIANIAVGTIICLIETLFNKGATLCRSAGSSARLIKKDFSTGYAIIRLKSGVFKSIPLDCKATIGMVSNVEYRHQYLGKAGASRWKGLRPHVRGVAMNPVDHPHGGGQGKTSGGRPSVTPFGKLTKGFKTRTKPYNKFHLRQFNG